MLALTIMFMQCSTVPKMKPRGTGRELSPCPKSPNCVSSLSEDESHCVKPLAYEVTVEKAKKKLIVSQRENDIAILNRDDPLVWALKEEGKFQVYAFSRNGKVSPGCFLNGDWIVLSNKEEEKLIRTSVIPLIGIHNQENIMASALVGHILGIPSSRIKEPIKSFRGLEHRLEKVTSIRGVDFYDDSKATNVDATSKSIQSFDRNIILI